MCILGLSQLWWRKKKLAANLLFNGGENAIDRREFGILLIDVIVRKIFIPCGVPPCRVPRGGLPMDTRRISMWGHTSWRRPWERDKRVRAARGLMIMICPSADAFIFCSFCRALPIWFYSYIYIYISLYIHVNIIRHDSLSIFMNSIIYNLHLTILKQINQWLQRSFIPINLFTKHCSLNMFCQLNLYLLTFSAALMCHGEVITLFLRSIRCL